MTHQQMVWVVALRTPALKRIALMTRRDSGEEVGTRDHAATADGVEEMADGQGADEIAQREEHEVVRRIAAGDAVDLGENQRVGEEDRVVEERLGDHQRRAENGPPRIRDEQGAGQRDEADVRGGCDLDCLGVVDVSKASLPRPWRLLRSS